MSSTHYNGPLVTASKWSIKYLPWEKMSKTVTKCNLIYIQNSFMIHELPSKGGMTKTLILSLIQKVWQTLPREYLDIPRI